MVSIIILSVKYEGINHDYFYGSYKENKNHGFPLQSYVCSLYRLHGQ